MATHAGSRFSNDMKVLCGLISAVFDCKTGETHAAGLKQLRLELALGAAKIESKNFLVP